MKTKAFANEDVEQHITAALDRMRHYIQSRSIGTQVVKLGEAAGTIHAQLRRSTCRGQNIERKS